MLKLALLCIYRKIQLPLATSPLPWKKFPWAPLERPFVRDEWYVGVLVCFAMNEELKNQFLLKVKSSQV
jgi:hypothetical protein